LDKYREGDNVILRDDSASYTGPYAGTLVTIESLDTDNHCTVIGYDGKRFMCPYSYIVTDDDEDFFTFEPSQPTYPKCQCGASKVYGDDCPPFYHYDYCPLYKVKEGKK
jgi:hypothetical protein